MSLRLKFLSLLVLIPSLCLGLFLYFAVSTFIKDKTSYLFENQFQLLNSADLLLSPPLGADQAWAKIKTLLKQEGFENLLVLDTSGEVKQAGSELDIGKSIKTVLGDSIYEKLLGQNTSEGGFEAIDNQGRAKLVSFLRINLENEPFVLLLHSDKSGATRASVLFFLKSLSAFAALICFAIIISLLFSNQLTGGIRILSEAMLAFGKGDFDAPLPKVKDDEVGQMTRQFEAMRIQTKSLMASREEKAKIETEMKLAGDLQRRFFPASFFEAEGTELAGFFEPANEAGGDWWFYFQKERTLVFLIGDVTGHGLNSAMLTGISRAAFSLIEEKYQNVSTSLRLLNRAIFDSAGGELNMTCFICALDLDTGRLSYSNASHENPIIIPSVSGDIKKKDFRCLVDSRARGSRLGEKLDAQFSEVEEQLAEGESLLLYSDGLTDLYNPEGQALGERRLLKILGTQHSASFSAHEILLKVKTHAHRHRSTAELTDDLSFLVVKWRKPS